ncbi:MAG: hypothetical protein KJN81_07590 [Acidimicrobiia bacterium]|nr:hypothetical protein [Acidimicrobiia bacterium]NNL47053.1 hypothetical protein [Acidimicrobiia bacterium]
MANTGATDVACVEENQSVSGDGIDERDYALLVALKLRKALVHGGRWDDLDGCAVQNQYKTGN